MTPDEAVKVLRRQSENADLVRDAYLDADPRAAAERFGQSGELAALLDLVPGPVCGMRLLDLGAGNGMASRAFAAQGASVVAIEPDPSSEIGHGAIMAVRSQLQVAPIAAYAEAMPLASGVFDGVFCRQVLHHTRDLERALREISRVLAPGGWFIAAREHVAETEDELAAFLAAHPVHVLTGGENAFPVARYHAAIAAGGLMLTRELGPWDSVINAFPAVRSQEDLDRYGKKLLRDRLGPVGGWAAGLPVVRSVVWARIRRPVPGRLYTFVARKPG